MRARIAIAFCGAVGVVVLARTAAYYQRQDALAMALVATMAVAFTVGLVELLWRAGRAERLAREVAALPSPATESAVDRASPPLRALLRARLVHAPFGPVAAPLSPYLVGLLVMLGLLGTFLGLFETLRGAREALTASGDIDALRASLALPMQGLTRSFGTSAAGVSTSAMLGLAAALARRSEARLSQTLGAYASGTLAPLTVGHRQLVALERIATQGEALPLAAAALQKSVATLASLETSWAKAHADASQETTRALGAAVDAMRSELASAIERSAESAGRVFTPLMQKAVDGTQSAVQGHLASLRQELETDREGRRARDAASEAGIEKQRAKAFEQEEARAKALASRWDGATAALREAASSAAQMLERLYGEQASRSEARDRRLFDAGERMTVLVEKTLDAAANRLGAASEADFGRAEALRELFRSTEAQTVALAESSRAQLEAVDAALARIVARTDARDARAEAERAASDARVAEARAANEARAVALEKDLSDAHAAYASKLAESSRVQLDAVDAMFAKIVARADDRDVRTETERAVLVASVADARAANEARAVALETELARAHASYASKLAESSGAQLDAVGATLATIVARADDRDARAEQERAALLASVAETRAANEARAVALENELARAHASYASELAARLGQHEEGARARIEETADVVRDAASLVHAGGAELGAVAEMFASAVDRHGQAAATWLESLGAVEAAIEQAGDAVAARGLADQMDRARELFDVQLQFHRELLVQLRAGVRAGSLPTVSGELEQRERVASDAPT